MLIVSTTGATHIGDQHESEDGIFDVDAELGAHLLAFPGWRLPTGEEASGPDEDDDADDEESVDEGEKPAPTPRPRSRNRSRSTRKA